MEGPDEQLTLESVRSRVPKLKDAKIDYGQMKSLGGFSIKLAWILAYSLLQRSIADPAITPLRYSMLELIGANPGQAQIQLGNALGLSRSAASLAIDFWEDRGCVERRTEPNDRRSFGIYLTDAGKAERTRLNALVCAADAALLEKLSADEATELNRLLAKIHL